MSSLWTPDGERPVNRDPEPAVAPADRPPEAELTPEQQDQAREMAKQMADARAQLLAADAADLVANHAMGLYELAAIHLTAEEPDLSSARLAVDALGALVDGLPGRLGQHEETLNEALHSARMAFVQRSQNGGQVPDESAGSDGATTSTETSEG
jgi:hypothetical protein